jgi:hypothetical protein
MFMNLCIVMRLEMMKTLNDTFESVFNASESSFVQN